MINYKSATNILKDIFSKSSSIDSGFHIHYNDLFDVLGSYSGRNAKNTTFANHVPHRPCLSAGYGHMYRQTNNNAAVLWANPFEYATVTMTAANGMKVPFAYTQIVKNALNDIMDPNKQQMRELVSLQGTDVTGGSMDLAKTLIYGAYSTVMSGELTPPIMPCVKALASIMDAYSIVAMTTPTFNSLDEQDTHDAVKRTFVAYASVPGVRSSSSGAMNPTIYTQWITVQQFLSLSINESYCKPPLGGSLDMHSAIAVGAHVFVPILKKFATADGIAMLAWGLAFSGYNSSIEYQSIASGGWSPMGAYNAWQLPSGFYLVNGQYRFYITFVVIDSTDTNPISMVPYNIAFNAWTSTVTNVQNAQLTLLNDDTGKALRCLLQIVKWCSGSQFPRVFAGASYKTFRAKPVWDSYNGPGFTYNQLNVQNVPVTETRRMRYSIYEYLQQPTLINGVWVATEISSTMPYDSGNAIIWCLGQNSVISQVDFNASRLMWMAYSFCAVTLDKISTLQLRDNTFYHYTQAGTQMEVNQYFKQSFVLFPKDIFGMDIYTLKVPMYYVAVVGGYNVLNGPIYVTKHAQSPLGISDFIIDSFSKADPKDGTLVHPVSNGSYVTFIKSPFRYPWYNDPDHNYRLPSGQNVGATNYYPTINRFNPVIQSYKPNSDDGMFLPVPTQYTYGGEVYKLVLTGMTSLFSKKSDLELILKNRGSSVIYDDSDESFLLKDQSF